MILCHPLGAYSVVTSFRNLKSQNLVYVVCVWPLLTILVAASEQIKNFIIKVIKLFTGCSFTEKLNSFKYVKIDSTYLIDEFFCPDG